MERLTEKHFNENGYYMKCSGSPECDGHCGNCNELEKIVDKLAAYENTGLEPEQVAIVIQAVKEFLTEMTPEKIEALREFEKLAQENRIAVLPCAIGSTVYVIGHKYRAGRNEWWINPGKFRPSDLEKIGTRVFLTREEAEKALEERKKSAN